MKKLRCAQCGKGNNPSGGEPGRREWYKTMEVEVPADFAIPTCDRCGEEWLSVRQSQARDGVLETGTRRSLSGLPPTTRQASWAAGEQKNQRLRARGR